MFLRVREQVNPDSRQEWESVVHAVEQAKNRLYNRSGFSPAQRQLGQNIRIPGSLGSDDPFESTLVRQGAGAEVQRLLQMREAAMEAFIMATVDAVRRAARSKTRTSKEFAQGEVVYVYRKPLARRSIRSASDTKRAQWVGPGIIIVTEGANVWVLCEEKCGSVPRSKSEEQPWRKKRPMDFFVKRWRSCERRFSERVAREDTRTSVNLSFQQKVKRSSSSSSSDSKEEPEGEKIDEGQMDSAVQSLMRSEVLDGTMRPQDAAAQYGPRRARLEQMRFKPYNFFVINEEEKQEDPSDQIGAEEEWIFCEERKSLIRRHGEYRKGGFIPVEKRGSPIDPKFLQSQCRVVKHYLDGKMEVKKMNWRKREEKEVGPQRHWVGETEFFIKANCVDKIRWHMMAKKSSDEVRECDITPEEWPEWKIADAEEWEKVASTNAVRAMSVEESKDVMNQLREGGIQDRVLPSRMVRRWKPAEFEEKHLLGSPASV